jgi:hypothetical protein
MNRNRNTAKLREGRASEVRTYQLDKLFGLALTDARFFNQLRETPERALTEFSLTASEAQAVLSIVPSVRSIEELAVRLEDWEARFCADPVEARAEDQLAALRPPMWRLSLTNTAQAEPVPECVRAHAG